MFRSASRATVATLAVLVALPGVANGQADPRELGAKEIAALVREKGETGRALQALRRIIPNLPANELDAIADSLEVIAISLPGADGHAVLIRGAAVGALVLAGAVGEGGAPFLGAGARLVRIAESRSSERGGALAGLTRLADKGEAVRLVARVATFDGHISAAAVGHLARDLGPVGLATLRDLYRRRAVTDPSGRQALAGVAKYRGWPRGAD